MLNASHSPWRRRIVSGFALFGGAIAWTGQLLAAALISEWSFFAEESGPELLDFSLVAWSIAGISVVMIGIATGAVRVAMRMRNHLRWEVPRDAPRRETAWFLANFAALANAMFLLLTIVQTMPLLFFV